MIGKEREIMAHHATHWQPLVGSGQDATGSWGVGVVEADDENGFRRIWTRRALIELSAFSGECSTTGRHYLALLLGRSDQYLVDGHMPRPGDDEADGVGDVCGFHGLSKLGTERFEHFRSVVKCQLCGGGTRFYQ